MNFILNLFTILLISNSGSGQVIDSARIKCLYKLTYVVNIEKPQNRHTELMTLFVGSRMSYFFSHTKFLQDSMLEVNLQKGSVEEYLKNPTQRNLFGISSPYFRGQYYIGFPEDKITVIDQIGKTKFIYHEEQEKMLWKIYKDTITINGYKCQKAGISFKGRNYEAWFTEEIPISAGPFKFNGLPGLIIKIGDVGSNYLYECVNVEMLGSFRPIIYESENCIKTTRTDFRKAFQVMFDNPLQILGATISGPDADKLKAALSRGLPYNPIELE